MAINLKVYLMNKSFVGEDIFIMGKKIKDYTKSNFPYAVKIDSIEQIDSSNTDFLALIYPNSPLCDIDFLKEKCVEMKAKFIRKYLIGDGYLENLSCDNDKEAIVSHSKATKVIDFYDLSLIYNFLKREFLFNLSKQNILVLDPNSLYIESTVQIGEGSIIYPMVTLKGKTKIGKNCKIHPYNMLEDTLIGDNTEVHSSFSQGAQIGANCSIGPFATLRKGAVIGDFCRVGDYVEIKKSTLKDNVKVAHLAYIGDSFIDQHTNVGCGTVFANYDGKQKRSVRVGSNVFIGANVNLIAPLNIGNNVTIAAGSTVTKDLEDNSLCIARSRETIKKDYFANITRPKGNGK